MAKCETCGREGTRVRTIFHESSPGHYSHTTDECPGCNPGSFDPRWLTERGVMGWEAYPEKYKKVTLPDGRVSYQGTDELRADTEARLMRESEDDRRARELATAKKRRAVAAAPRTLTKGQQESIIANFRKAEAEKIRQRQAELGAMASGLELPS